MRKLISILTLILVSGAAHAQSDTQLIGCVDTKSFEMNESCVAKTITLSDQFKMAQQKIINTADANTDFAVATITLDPETLDIEIVAHRDALQTALVEVNTSSQNK